MTQTAWPNRIGQSVATEVRRHRQSQGMSAQQLADRCAALGFPIGRSVLANFESGRRPALSVPELLVLAKALGVPPGALLFPVGRVDQVEPLPDRTAAPWDALQWFTGEQPLDRSADYEEWREDRAGLDTYRWHARYLDEWHADQDAAARANTEHARAALLRQAAGRETPLWDARRRLRGLGLKLPELPAELRHIDDTDYRPDWGNLR
ncbi:helix-turn-helix domain-containing protein [Streptomyces sp. MAR25Y5]|uniref:helix-turn-helix domain-containing protein n=1 Tax=Streptomyces sp. MAR25Y5 TaxID=2962028 RepID=UPI0020B787E9|nr:helix-turn-helix transcriptional regulator [Streptomyces sp. MAR25Y5]MCP3769498.1 helix-turn-helix domain-containing protein [Streptomyces sp. MAR25Y5]